VQIWVEGEPLVRHYTSADAAFTALRQLEKDGKKVRVVYAHDRDSGLKLFARDAWFVNFKGDTSAFLTRASAEAWATRNGGSVVDFAAARGATPALAAK
jgi:NitT/TauT family transport system substrate-binding protein